MVQSNILGVFPGQGSQAVGMGHDVYQQFPCVHLLYEEISDTVGANIADIAFHGPEDILHQTHHAQAALCATSIALLKVMEEEFGHTPQQWGQVAGHSMGEYMALYAAGVLTLRQTMQSIGKRGQAMARIVGGGMFAVLGLDHSSVQNVIEQGQHQGWWAVIANDNHPTQKVIATLTDEAEAWQALFKKAGALKCIPLKVSGPFHSLLMQPAQDEFWSFMATQEFCPPSVSVVNNVTATPTKDIESIRHALSIHMTHPVRWTETLQQADTAGIDTVVEIGSGTVLSGLARKTCPHLRILNVNDVPSLLHWGQCTTLS